MRQFRCVWVALALTMVPALVFAQKPAKYIGDDKTNSTLASDYRDRLKFSGDRTSSNVGGVTDLGKLGNPVFYIGDDDPTTGLPKVLNYKVLVLDGAGNPVVPRTLTDATLTLPVSAATWLAFVRDHVPRTDFPDVNFNGIDDRTEGAVVPLSLDPPRNKITVIDQGARKALIDAGLPPDTTTLRLVTVVTNWTDVTPIYANACVTGYPCCCTRCFSYISGYTYTPRSTTTTELRPVEDYPLTQIAVDRGIVLLAGSPQYTTQVPRLCEFTYGPGATINLPTVPLVTDASDTVTTPRTNVTVTTAGGVTTTITEPIVTPLVAGSEPVGTGYGGLTVPPGRQTGTLPSADPSDRGTNTFPGDKATVANLTSAPLDTSLAANNPYRFHEKP